jgi:CBS domain containing-hemolysin-like protein
MMWVLFAACLVVSFIFSGIEAGILSVNRVRLAHRVRQGDRAAIVLQALLMRPDRLLITVLVVTNLANICALYVVTERLEDAFGNWGYLFALAVYLPTYLLGLELLPKSLFRRFPYRALVAFAGPLRLVDLLLTPMHLVGQVVQRLLFGRRAPERQRLFIGREDFRYYTEQGEKTGALTKAEREMITNVVDFRGVVARDVMKPVDAGHRIAASAPVSELLEKTGLLGQDRWLVTDEQGVVTGIVSAFEVLLERRRDVNVGVYQRRAVTVTPDEPAYSVLRKLRAARGLIAIVRGPNQSQPAGQITWEDLIRRLVAAAGEAK